VHPFEVMSEPIRRRIVEMLASGEHLSGEIEAIIIHEFGVGRSAVQHHLAILRRLDWVIVRDDWNMRGYRLNGEVVTRLASEVRRIRRRWNRRIGWVDGVKPPAPSKLGVSRKGRRGRGMDPDDPWRAGRD
jgi:DNA-binding transcriptional ArsR family regulator